MQLIHEWWGRIFSSEHDFSSVQYDAIINMNQYVGSHLGSRRIFI